MAMRLNKNVEKLDVYKPAEPYSKVSIYVGVDQNGDEVYYTAGDDSGKELLIECPWGTSTMASVLLAKIGGYAYNGYDAKKAILNPAAELGDAVNVDGVASRIYTQKTNFDALYSSDIAAPPNEEIDDDYTYYSPDIKATRKLATTVATLRVNVDSIEAEVSGKIDEADAKSLIQVAINGITLSVTSGTAQNTSKITMTGTGISAVSDNITLTANSINLNTATVTGTLGVNNIDSIGKGVTLLSNATGTTESTTDILWIGPHTMNGSTIASSTTLIGTYVKQWKNTNSRYEGIGIGSRYLNNGSDYGLGYLSLRSNGVTTSYYHSGNTPTSQVVVDETGIEIDYMGGIKIKVGPNDITFTNSNGSCTLSQILAVV